MEVKSCIVITAVDIIYSLCMQCMVKTPLWIVHLDQEFICSVVVEVPGFVERFRVWLSIKSTAVHTVLYHFFKSPFRVFMPHAMHDQIMLKQCNSRILVGNK